MNEDDNDDLNPEQEGVPEDYDFSDLQQMAADELTDETTSAFLTIPYQDTEDSERVPTLMSCDEELIDHPRAGYELYTSLAGMLPIGLAQQLENIDLKGAVDAIEFESRTTAGEHPANVRHELNWHVKTPTVYRYLEQEYIDKFFEEGIIQLSSFAQFAEHEDEARKDSDEGVNIMTVEDEDSAIIGVGAAGRDAYVFCGSTIASDELMEEFGVDGYFKINDTRAFAREISKSLEQSDDVKQVKRGVEGFCEYADGNRIQTESEVEIPEELKESNYKGFSFEKSEEEIPEALKGRRDDGKSENEKPDHIKDISRDDNISVENIEAQLNQAVGYDPLFVKDKQYQQQSEYRWLWHVDGEMSSTIQIECMGALEYCERVTE